MCGSPPRSLPTCDPEHLATQYPLTAPSPPPLGGHAEKAPHTDGLSLGSCRTPATATSSLDSVCQGQCGPGQKNPESKRPGETLRKNSSDANARSVTPAARGRQRGHCTCQATGPPGQRGVPTALQEIPPRPTPEGPSSIPSFPKTIIYTVSVFTFQTIQN